VTLAQGGGSSTISAASGSSSATGVVTFTVKSTVAQAVTYAPTDSTDGIVIAQTATVTYTAGGTSAATSTIAGTGPVTANGVAASTVTIVLRDAANNPRPGITPTFSATGSTNALSACSATNALGVATCGLTSTKAEGKTLSLVSPVAVTGNTVTFVAGPPAAGNSTITATSPVTADGLAVSTVTITVKDAFDNPVTGAAPLVAVTGSGNVMGACPSTNASGTSTCSLASTTAEAKTVSVTSPVAIAGVTVTFVAAAISNNAVGNTDGSSAGSAGGAVAGNTGGAATGNTGALVSPNFGVTTPTSSSNGVVPGGNSSMATAAPMPPSAGAAPSAPEPASAVTVTVGPPVAANSVIVATSPVTADGLASSNVLITLRDASNNPVANVVPSFTATGAGNVVGGCSATNALGTATCRLASTRAESKTLAITSPVSVRGGTVRFTPGPAASATIAGTGPVPADGVRTSTITITLRDAFDNPLSGTTPAFSASGSSNVVGPCSPSDQSGHSTCTLASTVAEEKTLFITTPVIATGATVRFLPGAADHLVLTPTRATLTLGESQRYTAEARDPNNNDLGDITAGTSFSISPDGTCLGSVCSAASAGPHVVTASRQGMTGTTTMQIVYGFAGPHAPYAPPSQKSFRLRSTIALRWHYTASRGVAVASANAAPIVTIAAATCDGAEATTAPAVTDRRSGGYLYDPATHTWQYEWKTAGSGAGCYAIRITSGQTGQTAGPFVIKLAE
jgi:Big-like domain-containing protein